MRLFRPLLGNARMFRPKKTTAPAKKVWRISESAPMGEWVKEVAPAAPQPSKDLPDVSSGTWVTSSYDLLEGTDVTEDALPAELFDDLFARKRAAPKKPAG
jgi:hypothetical protein